MLEFIQNSKVPRYYPENTNKHTGCLKADIHLATQNRIFLVRSRPIWTNSCGIRVQSTQKSRVKLVLEKSKVFFLGM